MRLGHIPIHITNAHQLSDLLSNASNLKYRLKVDKTFVKTKDQVQ
jgi:hypothetical protein